MLQVFVFDVGNGSCAYLADSSGHNMMIDCGRDDKTNYSPALNIAQCLLPKTGDCMTSHPLTSLVITHPHRDHISDLPTVLQHLRPYQVTFRYISEFSQESIDDPTDPPLAFHREILDRVYIHPVVHQPIWHMRYQIFALTPAEARLADPQRELNNASQVVLVEYAGRRILFGGDMEEAGWIQLLLKEDFRLAISRGVDVFVASHHGHRSGFCDFLYQFMGRPLLHVASLDRGNEHLHPAYATPVLSRGFPANWWHHQHNIYFQESRYLLTTRTDGHVKLVINPTGSMSVFLGHREAILLDQAPVVPRVPTLAEIRSSALPISNRF